MIPKIQGLLRRYVVNATYHVVLWILLLVISKYFYDALFSSLYIHIAFFLFTRNRSDWLTLLRSPYRPVVQLVLLFISSFMPLLYYFLTAKLLNYKNYKIDTEPIRILQETEVQAKHENNCTAIQEFRAREKVKN